MTADTWTVAGRTFTSRLIVGTGQVQPTPAVASESARAFVGGLIALEGRMVNLLKLDNVLADVRAEAA